MNLKLTGLGESKKTSTQYEIRYCCPFCDDQKYKLYVNLKKGVFLCQHCKSKGKLDKLHVVLDNFEETVERLLNRNVHMVNRIEKVEVSLPPEFIYPIKLKHGLPYTYLRDRLVTATEQEKFHIGFCSEGRYAERIIIPIYEFGSLKYFVGRTYTNREPRYLNAMADRKPIIFTTFKYPVERVFITEGIFDALRVGKLFPAASILGKVISKEQAIKISRLAKEAYIMLDKDAAKDSIEIVKILGYYIRTKIMFIEKKDPGSMSVEEILKAFVEQ